MAILQTHSDTRTRNFTNLPLGTSKRVLIISPHPDDETISAGGLIQVALDLGAEVKIVIVTNGDGQVFAPLVLKGQFRPRPADFITHGERRQSEAIASLSRLGVSPRDIFFLGYPDRGLNALWLGDWTNKCPVRAAYTKAITNPYSIAFNHKARYCGSDLLADLQTIFQNYSPDFVVLPHPNDEHPDHRAISNFVRLVLALQIMADVKYHIEVWGYLIHYGSYPQPRGLHINRSLLLPKLSSSENIKWAILNLTAQQVQVKYAAVQSYITQRRLLGSFLPTFIRPNENFINLCIPDFVLSKESSFIIPSSLSERADKAKWMINCKHE